MFRDPSGKIVVGEIKNIFFFGLAHSPKAGQQQSGLEDHLRQRIQEK
jgi:hypothetical protein